MNLHEQMVYTYDVPEFGDAREVASFMKFAFGNVAESNRAISHLSLDPDTFERMESTIEQYEQGWNEFEKHPSLDVYKVFGYPCQVVDHVPENKLVVYTAFLKETP